MSTEFYVNEKGCYELQRDMTQKLLQIKKIVEEIEGSRNMLIRALGENDYTSVMNKVSAIKTYLEYAEMDLKEIIDCTSDYIERVKQIHIVLNS